LQRTRRFPPSDEELRLSADARDRLAQLQHAEDTAVEQRAPKIETKGFSFEIYFLFSFNQPKKSFLSL
jgi:hypothetical protein